jgi:sigma-B regulation protein RsbU (phosphoserine phosphatase)
VTGFTGTHGTATGHTATGSATRDVTGVTGTATATGVRGEGTRTIFAPLTAGELPSLAQIGGLRLDQLLLLSTSAMIVTVVVLLAALSSVSTQSQFEATSAQFNARLQASARELGRSLSHTLALTSATSLRDNNFSFLGEVAQAIVQQNENILRVQLVDADGLLVADTEAGATLGEPSGRKSEQGVSSAYFRDQAVFEFQEPIDYGSSAGKGLAVLTYSLAPLQAQIQELDGTKRALLRTNTLRMVGLGAGFVLLAGLVAFVLSRRITRPLGGLTQKVMELAQGDLSARADPQAGAGREVRALAVVFNHMAERIRVLLEDVRAKAQLEREVSLARTVQETFLPGREAVQVGAVRVAGLVVTADACGGDWWLRSRLGDGRVVVGLGDVTGHGLSTALVATSATSGFAAALSQRDPHTIDAAWLITSLNQTLHMVARGEYQMSCALAVIDPDNGHVDFAAGGHPSAYVVNRDTGKVSALLARGALLGAKGGSEYASRQTQLQPGDRVVWYTDGLTECRDAAGKQYGPQRLQALLQANAHLAAETLRDVLIADARAFSAGRPAEDDTTVLVVEYAP